MDISVTAAGEEQAPAGPVPAAAGSPLINLRAVRQAKLAKLHLDLAVPRWDEGDSPVDQLIVRYRPLNNSAAIQAVEKRQASKADEWITLANADQLVSSCVGVYVKVDGKPFTLAGDGSGNWVEFDPDTAGPAEWVSFSGPRAPELAAALGIDLEGETSKAVALVRGVYFTDGDMSLANQQLTLWSSKTGPQADEEALGE